jgi:hypothetical protein
MKASRMTFEGLIERIPKDRYQELSERLLDALLEVEDTDKVPSSLAKTFLNDAHNDHLASEIGLNNLMKAVNKADPDKLTAIMNDLGIE